LAAKARRTRWCLCVGEFLFYRFFSLSLLVWPEGAGLLRGCCVDGKKGLADVVGDNFCGGLPMGLFLIRLARTCRRWVLRGSCLGSWRKIV